MNSRKLSKDKRNRLALVVVITLAAAAGLYFGLIRVQHESLARLSVKKVASAQKLQVVLDALHRADTINAGMAQARKKLDAAESDVAVGDLYAWVINSLRQFKAPYKVEIPQLSQLGPAVDVTLLPNFPYKQATLTMAGTAHYHDLGRFLADFENQFPHVRLLNLSLDANAPASASEAENLSFKVDVVTLVKLNPS
jgi:hypothetical protein